MLTNTSVKESNIVSIKNKKRIKIYEIKTIDHSKSIKRRPWTCRSNSTNGPLNHIWYLWKLIIYKYYFHILGPKLNQC